MTRTDIKQAADEARDMKFGYRTIYEKYMIAADELIDKLEADKAKLREALIKCKWALRLETSKEDDAWDAAVDALEETSDE